MEFHTNEQREAIFISDLEGIKAYLSKVFKIDVSDIYFRHYNFHNQLVLNNVDEERVKSFLGKVEYEELQRFYSKMSEKLRMFSIAYFRVQKDKIVAIVDYKANIEIVTLEEK